MRTRGSNFERAGIAQEKPSVKNFEEAKSEPGKDNFDDAYKISLESSLSSTISSPLIRYDGGESSMSTISVGSEVKLEAEIHQECNEEIYCEGSNELSHNLSSVEIHSASQNDTTTTNCSRNQMSKDSIGNVNNADAEKGVKWCALTEKNSFSRELEEGEKEDVIDETMKCVTSNEESSVL